MSIKSELTKGVFWIAVAKYSGLFISLGVTAILARNVSPASFGTMAIATVVMSFLQIFADIGIGPAIIQFKALNRQQINTLFILGCAIGTILCVGLYFASMPIAKYYDDPVLTNVIRWLSLCLLFNALNIVPNGLMLKEKRFKTVALRTLSFQLLTGGIAIYGALNGWGIYALIITPVLSSIGVFIVNFVNYPQRLLFKPEINVVKEIFGYSSFQFLFTFSNYFSRNLDKLIIGKYFSMAQLGYYEKSYRLMLLPLQNITFVISPVLHPILSSLQNDKHELGEKNRQLLTVLSQISFPLGIFLFFSAYEIIMIIFGSKWEPSVSVFKILALSLPLQMLLSTSGSLYQAAGRTNHMFVVGLCNTVVTVVGFLVAAKCFGTLNAMAWAWNITLLINFVNSYAVMNGYTLRYPLSKFYSAFFPQIVNSIVTAIIASLLINIIYFDNLFVELCYKFVAVGLPTVTMAYFIGQYNIIDFLFIMWMRIRKRR